MSQEQETTTSQTSSEAVHTGHPTPMTYFTVAVILAALTAIEVAVFYANWLGYGIIPVLTILSLIKFALVGMFYMHLRYDARLFTVLFVAGLALAAAVVFALITLFRFFV